MLEGNLSAPILIVVDKPGVQEKAEGTCLSGRRREVLMNAFGRAGIPLASIALCFEADYETIKASQANVLVPLGDSALFSLTGLESADKWHCSTISASAQWGGRKCVPLLHPERVLKSFGDSAYLTLGAQRVASECREHELRVPQRTFHIKPTYKEALEFLHEAQFKEDSGIDIETSCGQINTFGVSLDKGLEAMAIRTTQDHWTPEEWDGLWRAIAGYCESSVPKIAQNFIYESMFLSAYGINLTNVTWDTMWAMKFLHPELEKGLHNVGRFYTPFPYWKDDNDDWNSVQDWPRHLTYNCLAHDMKVVTERGLVTIGELVRKKSTEKVLSWNEKKNKAEFKPITNWLRKKESERINWVRIETKEMRGKNGLYVTEDHKVLTQRGWQRADKLTRNDTMLRLGSRHCAGTVLGTLLGDSALGATSDSSVSYMTCGHVVEALTKFKHVLFGGTLSSAYRTGGYKDSMFHTLYVPPTAQLKNLERVHLQDALEHLTPLGLALWIMDDGCLQKGTYPTMKLALQSYTKQEQQLVLQFFRKRFDSDFGSIDSAGNLSIPGSMAKKLCAELGQFFIPEMRYKLSHEAPEFSMEACAQYKTQFDVPISIQITGVAREVRKKRGSSTSYCITVDDNHNFFTEFGVVANCSDTSGTLWAYHEQKKEMAEAGLLEAFNTLCLSNIELIREMCHSGLLLDSSALQVQRDKARRELEGQQEFVDRYFLEHVGRKINVRSPKQLKEALKQLGVKLPIQKGKESTDKKALVKLRKKHPDLPLLASLLTISKENKKLSSYLEFGYDTETKAVRYTLDGCGTETGRWSSYTDPWGNGFNAQTVPKYIRKCFQAKPGHVLVQIDLSQAESRYVAYDGPDPKLMELLETGKDVHTFVAGRIFNKNPDLIGKNSKERQLGKKAGHASNYGTGPKTFAEMCLVDLDHYISDSEAARIIEAYYGVFPGIRRRQLRIQDEIRKTKTLRTPLGRERIFHDYIGDNLFREAYAYAPQSTIPDITNALMRYLHQTFEEARFLVQVHDSILIEVEEGRQYELAEAARDYSSWHPKIELMGGRLIIPVDCEWGTHWEPMEKM